MNVEAVKQKLAKMSNDDLVNLRNYLKAATFAERYGASTAYPSPTPNEAMFMLVEDEVTNRVIERMD